jgi:hypothetical protein
MIYTVTIPQPHLLAILNLLQTVPAPMNQTYPIYEPLLRQMKEQDAVSALPVAGVFVDDDMSAGDTQAGPMPGGVQPR